jgi:hypothetical protein
MGQTVHRGYTTPPHAPHCGCDVASHRVPSPVAALWARACGPLCCDGRRAVETSVP